MPEETSPSPAVMLNDLIEASKEFERTGAWDQALSRYEQALMHLPREGGASHAAEILRWIGTVHRQRGELELAGEAYEASLTIAELNGLDYHLAAVQNCMGAVEHQRGNVSQAEDLYSRALNLAVHLDDQALAACVDQNLGALHILRGDLARALDSYESVVARSRALGDGHVETRALTNIGIVHMQLGNWEAAEFNLQRATELAEAAGESLMTGTLELNRAELHLQQQRFDQARECCSRSLDVFGRLRSKYWTAEAYKFYGILHRETGRSDQADACFAIALGLAEVAENVLLQAEAQMEWAIVHLEAGRNQEGIMYLNRALRLFDEMQARREVLDLQERLEKMEGLYLPAVQAWSADRLAEAHSGLADHSARVSELSCRIAQEVGFTGWDLTIVRVGALIHDIGYTAMPSSVLSVPDADDESHPLLKVHTVAGAAIAKRLDFPAGVFSIVRSHHEEPGGAGFPDRLVGEDIPRGTAIVALADCFDRLTNPLGKRPRLSRSRAIEQMAVDQYTGDPVVWDAFCRAVPTDFTHASAA